MQKTLLLLMLLLVSSFSFASSSDNVESKITDLLEVSNEILNKASIGNSDKYDDFIDLPSEATDFIRGLIKLGINFIKNTLDSYAQFLLFTPAQPLEGHDLQLTKASLRNSTFNSSLGTKFLIHGFFTELPLTSVFFEIKDSLLKQGDYNVIVVNWTRHNGFPYTFASINSAIVGFEIGKLIELLIDSANITAKSVHLIGHSLGAQSAGFTSKIIDNIGRISGLDAAGPIFQDLPEFFKLVKGDADFVDAIHTNGAPNLLEGLGTLRRYADVDFFPNGGSEQPNCSSGITQLDIDNIIQQITNAFEEDGCSHGRSLLLFLYSITSCRFESVLCGSYTDFKNGNCPPDNSTVARMGLYAAPSTVNSNDATFYLDTTGVPPYCETPN